MTKRSSEGDFGGALRDCDVAGIVYKPPDDARNMKPCDFMVWVQQGLASSMGIRVADETRFPTVATSAWFEVKDVDAVNAFPFAKLRPSQVAGTHDAERVGIPYWLAVYWRRHRSWTISDAVKLLAWRDAADGQPASGASDATINRVKSVSRELLMSRFGIDSTPAMLSSTLKSVLLGDI